MTSGVYEERLYVFDDSQNDLCHHFLFYGASGLIIVNPFGGRRRLYWNTSEEYMDDGEVIEARDDIRLLTNYRDSSSADSDDLYSRLDCSNTPLSSLTCNEAAATVSL